MVSPDPIDDPPADPGTGWARIAATGALAGAAHGLILLAIEAATSWPGDGRASLGIVVGASAVHARRYALAGAALGLLACPLLRDPRRRGPVTLRSVAGFVLVLAALEGAAHRWLALPWLLPASTVRLQIALAALVGGTLGALARGEGPGARGLRVAAVTLVALGVGLGGPSRRSDPGPDPVEPPAPGAASRPNVLVIVLDTVRPDHLGVYGYGRPTSPRIDALAREGVVYREAYAPSPWTVPSHASLLTGLGPARHHAHHERPFLARSHETLAETLRDHGYRTGAFVVNPYVGAWSGFDQGFGRFRNLAFELIPRGYLLETVLPGSGGDMAGSLAVDELLAWIDPATGDRAPFFALVNLMEAHTPYGMVPASDVDALARRDRTRRERRRLATRFQRDLPYLRCGHSSLAPEDRETLVDLYDAGIRYLDRLVGRVVDALDERDLLDRTLLVVTSDHGEPLGQHGEWDHQFALHEVLVRVPLVIRPPPRPSTGPGWTAGVPAQLVDLAPTILGIAGVPYDPLRFEGVDLRTPTSVASVPREIHLAYYRPRGFLRRYARDYPACDFTELDRRLAGVRVGRWKRVRREDGSGTLHDLATDPGETADLAARRREIVAALDTLLDRRASLEDHDEPAAVAPVVDDATRELLRRLGYEPEGPDD